MNGLKTYQVNDTIDHFKDSYFALGNLKQKNFQVEGQPVSFFTTFKKPIKVFAPEGPESYFKKILKEHRNFWREKEYPQYNILLIEQIKDEEAFQGCHMQQFASFMMPNVEEKHKKRVFQSFSHELFHEWLGYRMHFEQVQAPAQWFWEGFTDYYGLHLVHKSGLLSLREKIEHYNTHILIPYYTHPLNRLTSAEFEKRFKRRGGVAILAQYQGHMIATNLAALHLHSKGPNVDDLMRKIYAEFNGKTIDNQQLQKAFSDFYGNKIWGLLNEARINGELFILPENIFGKNICLVNKKIKVPSLGFDSEQLMLQNKIIKIDLKSNAYKAGLREAQEVESYTIEFHNIHKPCSVTIKEGGKSRNIIFYPEIVQKIIPQYKMKKKWLFI